MISSLSVADWNAHWKGVAVKDKMPFRDLAMFIRDMNAKKILEVGFGRGYLINHLSLEGYETHGAEISPEALKHALAHKKLISAQSNLTLYDGKTLPYSDGFFDLAFSQGLFEHFELPKRIELLTEQARVVGPGGHVIVDVPTRRKKLSGRGRGISQRNSWIEYAFNLEEVADMGKWAGLDAGMTYHRDYIRPLNIIRMLHDNQSWQFPEILKRAYERVGRVVDSFIGESLTRNGGVIFKKT